MAEFEVRVPHDHPVDEACRRVRTFEAQLRKLRVRSVWSGERARLSGMGLTGDVEVRPNEVRLVVRVSRLATMAGVRPDNLRATITSELGACLSAARV